MWERPMFDGVWVYSLKFLLLCQLLLLPMGMCDFMDCPLSVHMNLNNI